MPVEHAQEIGRLVGLCALLGVMAGLGAAIFETLIDFLSVLFVESASVSPYRQWWLASLPAIGGLVGGLLVYYWAPEAEGAGTGAVIEAYHQKDGKIRQRVPFAKTLTSVITLSTGGSAGREGPIAHIGAGLGSGMSRFLGLAPKDRRILMVAGCAAGIGAVFRAPLAAALFAAEVLYREMDLEFEVIVPGMISSIVAFGVVTSVLETQPIFLLPPLVFDDPRQLFPYALLTLAVAGGSKLFISFFTFVRNIFGRLSIPKILKPVLGGGLTGSFVFFLPEAMSSGYGLIESAVDDTLSIQFLIVILLAKSVTTSLTVGSGQSGGVFGPALVIGGLIGAIVGKLCIYLMPAISPPVGAFVVVGMAGFFAGAANAPISTVIMVSEVTGAYKLLVPAMWVCILSFILVRRSTLYPQQVQRRLDSGVHRGEMMSTVLRSITVGEALRAVPAEGMVTVEQNTPMSELASLFSSTRRSCFPVVDKRGRMCGVIDEVAMRLAVVDKNMYPFLVANDLVEQAPLLTEHESLLSAMRKMVSSQHDELTVVEGHNMRKPMAMLSRHHLIAVYDQRVRQTIGEDSIYPQSS